MVTTFQEYPSGWYQNYCSRPTQDVEILPDVHHCVNCEGQIFYSMKAGQYGFGAWVHKDSASVCDRPEVKMRCTFCHVEHGQDGATVVYRQEAWCDQTACSRCGGVKGYAIGD